MENIYKHIGLSKENEAYSLEFIPKIFSLHETFSLEDILTFFTLHEYRNHPIICNKNQTLSLSSIILESPFYKIAIPLTNNFGNLNVANYYTERLNELDIVSFEDYLSKNNNLDKHVLDLIVKAINNDPNECCQFIKFLPPDRLLELKINEFTLLDILKYSDSRIVHKLMACEFSSKEEFTALGSKLKSMEFISEITVYINSQDILNNTMLYCAMVINKPNFENIIIKNVNFNDVLRYFPRELILSFGNRYFKGKLFHFIMNEFFDIEFFLFSLQEENIINYDTLKNINCRDFETNEIIEFYFRRKILVNNDPQMLKEDVQMIIEHHIYDYDILLFLLDNDIDFCLFDRDVFKVLSPVRDEKLVKKYARILHKLGIESIYDPIFKYLDGDIIDSKLPVITEYDIFVEVEVLKLLDYYFYHYTINEFIEIYAFNNLNSAEVHKRLDGRLHEIKNPFYKVLIILKYKFTILNSDIKKLTKIEMTRLIDKLDDLSALEEYFCYDKDFPLTKSTVNKFYKNCLDKLKILEAFILTECNISFIKPFLVLIFTSKYDPSVVCLKLNIIIKKYTFDKNFMFSCINYYLNVVLSNDFFQAESLIISTEFLNILYEYMKVHGKDLRMYRNCEEIISRIKSYSKYFNYDTTIRNIKSI